jgi:hypothetical protein
MLNYGCIVCKNNKDRKLQFKKLKNELKSKHNCSIWYENNTLLYSYQSTRKEMYI